MDQIAQDYALDSTLDGHDAVRDAPVAFYKIVINRQQAAYCVSLCLQNACNDD